MRVQKETSRSHRANFQENIGLPYNPVGNRGHGLSIESYFTLCAFMDVARELKLVPCLAVTLCCSGYLVAMKMAILRKKPILAQRNASSCFNWNWNRILCTSCLPSRTNSIKLPPKRVLPSLKNVCLSAYTRWCTRLSFVFHLQNSEASKKYTFTINQPPSRPETHLLMLAHTRT